MSRQLINALTIDVEDYFQVSNFYKVIRFSDWDKYECRVERNTLRVLNVLSEFNIKATFFVLGWIAERYPSLIKKIHNNGHEVASHGYRHQLVIEQSPKEFREDIRITKAILEDITGSEVIGYRAPAYSITQKSFWSFEILIEEGFKYDSSIFPIRRYRYGILDFPRFPCFININGPNDLNQPNDLTISNGRSGQTIQTSQLVSHSPLTNNLMAQSPNNGLIVEFPVSTIRILANNFPIAGGGYFRLFPYQFTKWGLKKINQKEREPFIFYIHPWELDINQPRIKGVSNLSKFRHYINLDKTEDKLRKLLTDFKFSRVKDVLGIQPAIK